MGGILVVEDDKRLAAALEHILREAGYDAEAVHDGEDGLFYARRGAYDVVVLDVMLPRKNGFDVARDLRRAGVNTPILLLTARDAVPDKIEGLDSGADDYMTKPFAPAELLAHLRALTRRRGEVVFETLSAYGLTLDLTSRELSCGAESIHLSGKEFELARMLIAEPGRVVPKSRIVDALWGQQADASENNAEAYVSFLRKKLRFLRAKAQVETVRGVGYRLTEDDGREKA